ncbi:MAG: MarR family winged helix-turn-helix transcriptional regulator [Burkholderiaceae bacterium]
MKSVESDAATFFGFTKLLTPVRRAWIQAANHVLSEFGVPSSLATTVIIVARTGKTGIRQNALAEEVGVNQGGMVRLVDQAVDAGLVERLDDHEDRRAKIVRALPQGRALAARLEGVIAELREQTLDGIPVEDIETASRVMRLFEARIGEYLHANRRT